MEKFSDVDLIKTNVTFLNSKQDSSKVRSWLLQLYEGRNNEEHDEKFAVVRVYSYLKESYLQT